MRRSAVKSMAILSCLVSVHASAAVAPTIGPSEADLILALRLPLETRVQTIKGLGESALDRLKALSADSSQPLQIRWRAVTALGRLGNKKAAPFLEKALKSSDWLMRNAALLALGQMDRARGLAAASASMEDPALVVRTTAVKIIGDLDGKEKQDLLWQKLFAKENFHNGQSLWIRKHIADLLVRFARPGWESKFQKILEDEDESLHPFAILGLEKSTGERLGENNREPKSLRALWLHRLTELKSEKLSTEI